MIRLMLAAPASGSGKTAVACALLAALKKRRMTPCAFKCGPDYIDPMFHRAALGVESHNLDLFLSDEAHLSALFARCTAGHGAAVCEGVMGLYDGVGGVTDHASAWHVADALGLPVILVVRPKGASLTLAAQIRGLMSFRKNSHIIGVILNDCAPGLCKSLAPMLEEESGIPVLGCLPHLSDAAFESRYLGLYTADEIQDLEGRITRLEEALSANVDLERLMRLCDDGAAQSPLPAGESFLPENIPLAVAQDEAFCFIYAETLEALEAAGARVCFFSPLHDESLPEGVGGLYLPGGYPELYACELSKNHAMQQAVRRAVEAGLPTVAECGGFLYLGQTLEDLRGIVWPMAGVLPGHGVRREKLVRFGYAELAARTDSLLLRQGETLPVHEFHYWDSTENGDAMTAHKPYSNKVWQCGFTSDALYAAFPHLCFGGKLPLAGRFVEAAQKYVQKRREL